RVRADQTQPTDRIAPASWTVRGAVGMAADRRNPQPAETPQTPPSPGLRHHPGPAARSLTAPSRSRPAGFGALTRPSEPDRRRIGRYRNGADLSATPTTRRRAHPRPRAGDCFHVV